MHVTRLTHLSPVTLPAVPLNLLVDIRVRVRTHDNQHSFFVIPYSKGEVEKYSFGDPIYLHEDCTPDERPTYFYARAVLLPRDFPLPPDLKTGGLVSTTNEESAHLKPELDKLLHDAQAIVVSELDRVLDPEALHDTVGTNRRGFHVQWTIRPSYLVSGTLCTAKTGSPPRSKYSHFTVGPMAINWVGTDSSGTKLPGSFVVDSAQACGQDELHSGWTTTRSKEAAELLSVSQHAISAWLTGKRPPRMQTSPSDRLALQLRPRCPD